MTGDHRDTAPFDREEVCIPGTPADVINFALGTIDMMCVIAATLIGRGILEPDALRGPARQYAALWTEKQNPSRAAAAKLFGERLKTIERTKLMANERLIIPPSNQMN